MLLNKPPHLRPSLWSVWTLSIPRMDGLILQALGMPWLFGFGAFTTIGFSIGSLFDVLRRLSEGILPWKTALQVMALQLPQFVVLALPMSSLLASLITYNQLSKTKELMALRSFGTSIYRIVWPTFCCSLLIAGATALLHEGVVPPATRQAQILLAKNLSESTPFIPQKDMVYRTFAHQQLSQLIHARTFAGRLLNQVTLLQFKDRQLHYIWIAQRATWDENAQQWLLSQGTQYTINPIDKLYQQVRPFQQQLLPAATPTELARTAQPLAHLNIAETHAVLHLLQQSGDHQYRRHLQVHLHRLMAFPWIGVGFSVMGAALGCRSTQTSSSQGFGLSILLIFAYYTFAFICQTLGEVGAIAAGWAGWLPIAVLFLISAYGLYQANGGLNKGD